MNGMERITQRLDADAQAEIDRILGEARAQAAQIAQRYQEQAEKEAADLKSRNEKAAAEREERLISASEMEARKAALAARQEMVDRAFALALEKLCSLPKADYVKTAAELLVRAAPNGSGSVIFSEKDRRSVGEAVVEQANKKLGGKGHLALSGQTREIRGGFILVQGNVEVNCTFETLVRLAKGEIAGEAAKRLFPAGE